MKNALTIDLEDYFHVFAFSDCISPQDWHKQPTRLQFTTYKILDFLAGLGYKATFFALGNGWLTATRRS